MHWQHALLAVGVNGDGTREILGIDVASAEGGAGRLAFLRCLTTCGLAGVHLVISDAHRGLNQLITSAYVAHRCRNGSTGPAGDRPAGPDVPRREAGS